MEAEESLELASLEQWERWLQSNHSQSTGVWLILNKKTARTKPAGVVFNYSDILEAAISYGWIDARRKSASSTTFLQRFTPRGKRSIWSKINCQKANVLIANGRMHPAGLAEVERAKQDGRWARAYDGPATSGVPDDLAAELEKKPKARAFFDTLDSQNRYAILFRLQTAKKAETRARRLATFVEMLEQHRKIYS
ncbi:MAG TPA: YdeI/OmpD-associated family protein [Bryobacteraceae bacterium]